ncbi:hypothetical protein, partial [Pyrobaculum aerophilum]|uniref:hypothetical protein n=1 Tax=Pyrobaculum aerophilum TaxID=13773 RepID=UPI002FDB4F7A
ALPAIAGTAQRHLYMVIAPLRIPKELGDGSVYLLQYVLKNSTMSTTQTTARTGGFGSNLCG